MNKNGILFLSVLLGFSLPIQASEYSLPHWVQDQKVLLGALAVGAVALPSYLYFKKQKTLQTKKNLEQIKLEQRNREKRKPHIQNIEKELIKALYGPIPATPEVVDNYEQRKKEILENFFLNRGGVKNPEEKIAELKEFVTENSPPVKLYNKWISYEKAIYNDKYQDFETDFWAKDDLSRILNANLLKKYIEEKKFKYVDVPKKYIFFAGNKWKVMSQSIKNFDFKEKYTADKKQIEELLDIICKFGYWDFLGHNIVLDAESKKLFFIDTEDNAFLAAKIPDDEKRKIFSNAIYDIKNHLAQALDETTNQLLDDTAKNNYRNCFENPLSLPKNAVRIASVLHYKAFEVPEVTLETITSTRKTIRQKYINTLSPVEQDLFNKKPKKQAIGWGTWFRSFFSWIL